MSHELQLWKTLLPVRAAKRDQARVCGYFNVSNKSAFTIASANFGYTS
ncbi:hypothetical protein RE6C_04608 [Rhodopirellula europaea 6C]|uniref:Uncharacterized protein n=1 Tax=Rhodopirellula europaea 6C TaxID=1263867 RepID=M2A4R9_9BACT|nr:hypothetical protein RE6C_04608 [Rhodopirellula europaea 6C]